MNKRTAGQIANEKAQIIKTLKMAAKAPREHGAAKKWAEKRWVVCCAEERALAKVTK